jgi:hypothetical protein
MFSLRFRRIFLLSFVIPKRFSVEESLSPPQVRLGTSNLKSIEISNNKVSRLEREEKPPSRFETCQKYHVGKLLTRVNTCVIPPLLTL